MKPRHQSGLTLLELAIAMAVLVILGTLALPSFSARVSRERLTRAAETLAADISEARFQAARTGQALQVHAQTGADWCWSVSTAPVCDCAQQQACQVHRVQASSFGSVKLMQASAVQLAPDGTASSLEPRAATLQSAGGEQLVVSVGPLGRPRICVAAGHVGRYPGC